jgi:hypothetical protein
MYSIVANGVSHSSSFSAMIATTRSPKPDALVEGSSLGALPLDRDVYKTRLKFGESLEEKVMRVDILRLAYKMRF